MKSLAFLDFFSSAPLMDGLIVMSMIVRATLSER
jgi:hypothetical protein